MILGIPKEILHEEKRVAATPETVEKYRKMGFEVLAESGAGAGIYSSDEDYAKAGAKIISDVEELFAKADVVLKVKQPIFNQTKNKHEVDMMKNGTTLVTFIHPAAPDSHAMVKMLAARNITSFTMDGIPRISRAQRMDALTSMSTITGYKAVIMAAGHLPKFVPMTGTAIGTIKPANFLVVGAGVVGLQAVATAKRLGGVVKALEIRGEAKTAAASLGAKPVDFDVPSDLAVGGGGYAKALSKEWIEKERAAVAPIVAESDVIILSALVPGELAPVVITDEMVASMKPGSVIIDVSIDQGGNCASTVAGKETIRHGVLISGIQNIPGSMPLPASWLYANNIFYYVENLYKKGAGTIDMDDEIVKASLVTIGGKIVFEGALKAMGAK